jgi:hypothetical protein
MNVPRAPGDLPLETVRLLGDELRRRLVALRENLPTSDPLPPDASLAQELRHALKREPRASFQRLLEHANGLHGLLDLAAAVPREFLGQAWPWFMDVTTPMADFHASDGCSYERDNSLQTEPARPGNGFVAALQSALESVASGFPDALVALVERDAASEQMTVHRLLARGLAKLAPVRPAFAIDYVLADRRRLVLGDLDERDTLALLAAVAPHAGTVDLQRLEMAASVSRRADETDPRRDARSRRAARNLNRDHRIRLLHSLGVERLTPATAARVEQEARARPEALLTSALSLTSSRGSPPQGSR